MSFPINIMQEVIKMTPALTTTRKEKNEHYYDNDNDDDDERNSQNVYHQKTCHNKHAVAKL